MHSLGMPGTDFTSISDYLSANQDTVAREAGDLAGGVSGQIAGARSAADSAIGGVQPGADYTSANGYLDALGKQNAALDSAQSLQTQGGIADLLQKQQAKDPGYTQGKAYWDAGLLGGAAPFGTVQTEAKGLQGYLDAGGQSASHGQQFPADDNLQIGRPDRQLPTGDAPTRDPGKDWSDPSAPWHQHSPLPAPPPFGVPEQPNPYPGSLGEYLEGGP